MLRKMVLLIAVASFFSLAPAEPAQARKWSPGNPGIHGNIHGLTYRSSKWERDNGKRKTTYVRRSRGRFFRWR